MGISEAYTDVINQQRAWIQQFVGRFEIRFIGEDEVEPLTIKDIRMDTTNRPIILIGEDGTIYNYSTVISMSRIPGG